MGLHDSAYRIGQTLSAPIVGFAIDSVSPAMGFVAAACGGIALVGMGTLCTRYSTASAKTA